MSSEGHNFIFDVTWKMAKKLCFPIKGFVEVSGCRTCWSAGCSHGSSNMQGNHSLEYITPYVAHKKTALVWKTSNKIIPEFA